MTTKPQNKCKCKNIILGAVIVFIAWSSFWMGTTLAHRTRIKCEIANIEQNNRMLDNILASGMQADGLVTMISALKSSEQAVLKQLKEDNEKSLLIDLLKAPAAAPMREHILFYSCSAQ